MSPANSLFALACATILGIAYGSGCAHVFIGEKTNNVIYLPEVHIAVGERDAVYDIPDNCALSNNGKNTLAGEEANVCDYIVAPDITLGPAFSPLTVHRTSELGDVATVNIVQHCK